MVLVMCAQRESNPRNQLRRLVFYPLNYGRSRYSLTTRLVGGQDYGRIFLIILYFLILTKKSGSEDPLTEFKLHFI